MGSTLGLYLSAVIIWGSTWLVITYQLGVVAPEASIVYRFGMASALMLLWSVVRGKSLKFSAAEHRLFAAQGLFLFCINYALFYHSERFISSGLVALICSGMAFFNMFGMRLVYGQSIQRKVAIGSSLGVLGIVLVFWPELAGFDANIHAWLGVMLASIATVSASCGNLVSVAQRRRQLPVVQSTAWAMAWGTLFTLIYALAAGIEFSIEWNARYLGSLFYLVIFGSIAAFMSYLTLIAKVGADKAAYVNVTVPIIALLLSTLLEGFTWHTLTFVGVALSVLGNLLVMAPGWRQLWTRRAA